MLTNGIEVDPETGEGYDKLPVDREMRDLIRRVHSSPENYQMRYLYSDAPLERRSVAAPQRSESPSYRRGELDQERLRLKLAVLQRMRA